MDSGFYQEKILRQQFLPYVNTVYPNGHRLFQDNDTKHTSRSTQEFMINHRINWWKSPAESPDINPIENLWHELKVFRVKRRTKNKEELQQAIIDFWETVTVEKCNKYIDHIKTVIPVVIEKKGDVSGF